MKLSVDTSQIEKLSTDLRTFARKSVPYAFRDGLNEAAFQAREIWIGEIKGSMVLRNRWTLGSIRVMKARGSSLERMQAVLGSPAPYLAAQEEGKGQQLKGKHAIPTSAAAGQQGATPRTKLVRRPNSLASIAIGPRPHGGTSKQRNAIAMRQARKQGRKFVHLELAKGKGLFRIGARKPTMLWSTGLSSRPIPKNPTLDRTVEIINTRAPRIYYNALLKQARRAHLWGY